MTRIANKKEREILVTALQNLYEPALKMKAKDVPTGGFVIAKFVEPLDDEDNIYYMILAIYRHSKKVTRAAMLCEDSLMLDDEYELDPEQEVAMLHTLNISGLGVAA